MDGGNVISAYVEITFDNKDNRIPIDKEEVTLRRSIGAKKDEYFLDNKHIKKHEVMNLLESAGFSKSNPYYIIQQGKVNAIALMNATERFELLKEVAGTRVYDERRAESIAIIEETNQRRLNINSLLNDINLKLQKLEGEKEELKKYQQLDKDRRSLEFIIFEKELKKTNLRLETIESKRQKKSLKEQLLYTIKLY